MFDTQAERGHRRTQPAAFPAGTIAGCLRRRDGGRADYSSEPEPRLNRFFNELPARRIEDNGVFFADWAPAVDIQENDKEYLIKAELPEVKKEDVKVEMAEGVLSIEGERKQEKEEKGKKFHTVERSCGKFVRRFALPTEVETTTIAAEFKDGMLNVHLPKTAEAKPKTIEVKVA